MKMKTDEEIIKSAIKGTSLDDILRDAISQARESEREKTPLLEKELYQKIRTETAKEIFDSWECIFNYGGNRDCITYAKDCGFDFTVESFNPCKRCKLKQKYLGKKVK